jgi:hypothetical protein
MFPIKKSQPYVEKALVVFFIAIQLIFMGITISGYPGKTSVSVKENKQTVETNLTDNWERIRPETKDPQITTLKTAGRENITNLAAKYKADPEYLHYIIQVEKTFKLAPCELLALIAQETGFTPQTHMDGGSLSYSTTQMKMPAAQTAYMAITQYYNLKIPYPTDELLRNDKNYAAFLAGGYLRYLNDTYKNKFETYTAYNLGIGGSLTYYQNNGHFRSPYAVKVASLGESLLKDVGDDYDTITTLDISEVPNGI